MALDTTVRDGSGSTNRARVDVEGNLQVVVHGHPPFKNDVTAIPYSEFFTNGGSSDMRVNGSVTPVEFSVQAGAELDVFVKTVSVYIADAGAQLDQFGALTALTNGVEFYYYNDQVGEELIQSDIKTNLDYIRLMQDTPAVGDGSSAFRLDLSGAGADAYLLQIDFARVFGFTWGLKLRAATTDRLYWRIRDNVTGLDAYNAKAFGMQQ